MYFELPFSFNIVLKWTMTPLNQLYPSRGGRGQHTPDEHVSALQLPLIRFPLFSPFQLPMCRKTVYNCAIYWRHRRLKKKSIEKHSSEQKRI